VTAGCGDFLVPAMLRQTAAGLRHGRRH
jgi:hypothetical protein